MKIVIEDNKVYVNDKLIYEESHNIGLADQLAKHRGTVEYTGIVADIQKWYYGYISKSPWCATAISYFLNQLGLLDKIGGRAENVYTMLCNCQKASKEGKGEFYDKSNIPTQLKKDDILFWLWEGTKMTGTSNKHVGVCEYDTSSDTIYCIGANQKDKICTLSYPRQSLYAVYRIK